MATLKNNSTLNKAKVIVDILPKGHCIPNQTINATEIAIHNTGDWNVPAANYATALKRFNKENPSWKASYHFVVDDKEIYQLVDTHKKAWHIGNYNSKAVGIEICMFKDEVKQKQAEDNAIALVLELMNLLNITNVNKVRPHSDYMVKHCPEVILDRDGSLAKFRTRIKNFKSTDQTETTSFIVRIICDSLNVRKGAGVSYDKVGELKKGDAYTIVKVKNNWGKLKSGLGWISLGTKYVERVVK
jgi:N-acetylmuramoyl-L-alanine amidase